MDRKISYVAALICVIIAGLLWYRMGIQAGWPWVGAAVVIGMLHMIPAKSPKQRERGNYFMPMRTIE